MNTTNHELWLGDFILIGAEFRQVDESFDHDGWDSPRYQKAWEMVDGSFYVEIFIPPHNFEHSMVFKSKKDEESFKELLYKDFTAKLSAA